MERTLHILGREGAFHSIAARRAWGDLNFYCHADPAQVADAAANGAYALLAVENSLAGSIPKHMSAIAARQIYVHAEIWLRIQLDLCVLPGTVIDALEEVRSHPMAIRESGPFFEKYPHIKLVEWSDTASAAASVKKEGRPNVGAISSSDAADLYGLDVCATAIESHYDNWTRFLLLGSEPAQAAVDAKVDSRLIVVSALSWEILQSYWNGLEPVTEIVLKDNLYWIEFQGSGAELQSLQKDLDQSAETHVLGLFEAGERYS